MKKIIILILLVVLTGALTSCSNSTNTVDGVQEDAAQSSESLISTLADSSEHYGTTFGQGEVIDINIEVSDEDWVDILENAVDEAYHSVTITVNGTTVENVGFRTKGFSSLASVANSDSDRYGFKVKFDEYVDNQLLNGLDTLVLNASFSDPSYMREFLTYSAYDYLDAISPYVTYTKLSINGELFGFYLCIESYDDSFVERLTDSEDAVLYKAVSENCTLLTSDDGTGFEVQYGDDEDNSNITALITVLNNTTEENKEELEAILDVDSVLKAIAVNTVMGNYDSYSGSKAHNYYLLYKEGKFSYIGWDYNMSIGGFSEDNGASVTVDITSPVYNVELSQRPLIEKLLAIDAYNEKYLGYVDSLVEYFGDFEGMVTELASEIQTYVETDPSAFYTAEDFTSNITASDTDLSKVEAATGFGGMGKNGYGMMEHPDFGTMERPDGGTMEVPDGYTTYGSVAPDSTVPDTSTSEGKTGSSDTSDATTGIGELPSANGGNGNMQLPKDAYGNMQFPGGGYGNIQFPGGMISNSAVSIVDYITQRIAFITAE